MRSGHTSDYTESFGSEFTLWSDYTTDGYSDSDGELTLTSRITSIAEHVGRAMRSSDISINNHIENSISISSAPYSDDLIMQYINMFFHED